MIDMIGTVVHDSKPWSGSFKMGADVKVWDTVIIEKWQLESVTGVWIVRTSVQELVSINLTSVETHDIYISMEPPIGTAWSIRKATDGEVMLLKLENA